MLHDRHRDQIIHKPDGRYCICRLDAPLLYDRLDLKLRRIHYGLFYSTLICNFYQDPVIFLWETWRNDNLNYDLFKEHLSFVCLPVFKALDQRNMLGRNFPVLTETEHIDTRTRSD